MPIIKPKQKAKKEQIRLSIEKDILDKIKEYCDVFGIPKADDFFEQAAEHILSKDKDWLNHLGQKSTA